MHIIIIHSQKNLYNLYIKNLAWIHTMLLFDLGFLVP